MTDSTARKGLYAALMADGVTGRGHSPDRSEQATALIEAFRDETAEQLIPRWEASYDSATFTPRLLAYCNDLAAAKGAAEAWLRTQVDDVTGLTWVPDPQMTVREWDQWFELVRDNPYGDGIVDTEIVVRRRADRTTAAQES